MYMLKNVLGKIAEELDNGNLEVEISSKKVV